MNLDNVAGFIFGCTLRTENECREKKLFGLPANRKDAVSRIKPGTPLFLYNYDLRVLYGIFEARSHGGWRLEPDAWGGDFPSQIRVRGVGKLQHRGECLISSIFSKAIRENFFTETKFTYALTARQVRRLEELHRIAGWKPSWTSPWMSLTHIEAKKHPNKGERKGIQKKKKRLRPFENLRGRRVIPKSCPITFKTPPPKSLSGAQHHFSFNKTEQDLDKESSLDGIQEETTKPNEPNGSWPKYFFGCKVEEKISCPSSKESNTLEDEVLRILVLRPSVV